MTQARFRGILFDLDDTLVVDEAITSEAYERTGEEGVRFGADGQRLAREAREVAEGLWRESPYRETGGRLGIVEAECLWGNFETPGEPWEGLREWAMDFRERVFTRALRLQEIENPDAGAELSRVFASERRKLQRLMPDVIEVLGELQKSYRLGLVTNGEPDLQREKLAWSGLGGFFSAVVVSGELGIGKPEPGIFQAALEGLGIGAGEAVMVGNSLRRDVAGASGAGLKTVWLEVPGSEEYDEVTPDASIRRLSELPGALERLSAGRL